MTILKLKDLLSHLAVTAYILVLSGVRKGS